MTLNGRTSTLRAATTAADLAELAELVPMLVAGRRRLFLPCTIAVDCVPEGPSSRTIAWAGAGLDPTPKEMSR